jgi:hypothetical protein
MARLSFLSVGIFGAIFGLPLLCGCSSYVGDFQYVPHPALAEIPPNPPDKDPPVSAFASVMGVHRADRDEDIPQAVEVRFRLENNGPHTVTFDPQSLELMTGDLLGFDPPIVHPAHPVTISPSDVVMVDAFFPFPPGHSYHDTDMDSLQLRWREQIDQSPVSQSTSFRRIYGYRYSYGPDPYWGYPYYGGVVIVHHRRW